MTTQPHSIVKLFINHGDKPFDANFVKALNALVFLEQPANKIFNTSLDFTVQVEKVIDVQKISPSSSSKNPWIDHLDRNQNKSYYSDPDDDRVTLNSSSNVSNDILESLKLWQQGKSHQTKIEQETLNYTIGEWLLARLFINLNQPAHSERQFIYQIFDILKDKLDFTSKQLNFQTEKNKDKFITLSSGDLFIKIGLHSHIQDFFNKHTQLFNIFFQEHQIGASLVNELSIYVPEKNKKAFVQQIIENNLGFEQIKSFISQQSNDKSNVVSKITTPFWENLVKNCVNEKQPFSDNIKRFLLKQSLDKKLLDTPSCNNPDFLIHFEQYFQNVLKTNLLFPYLKASNMDSSHTQELIIKYTDNLSQHNQSHILFVQTLLEKADVAKKQQIYNLFHFTDSFIRKSIDYIQQCQISDQPRYELMEMMVNLTASHINRENLAHLISLDIRYMDFCNPLFLNIKLNETLPENIADNETDNRNRLKI